MYTHRKFDSQNGPFEPERSFTGIKFQGNQIFPKRPFRASIRESNFYGTRHMYTHRKFDFQNGPFEPEYAYQISRGIVEGECIHLIPKTALLSQKAALRESNFKKYGRRQLYTHRKFDSQNGPFEPERSFTGIKFQEVWYKAECIHTGNLIPKTALLSQKEAFRESNFKRYR